ncbi:MULTISPECIES: hypothetical protein [unclassified Nonomuraea]|uniref:hypothetical protein n=1 Tax=unclassified Nonomuraea TaxID=2593643 RepID=UPI0033D31C9B
MDTHWGTMRRHYTRAAARAQAMTALSTAGYEVWSDPAGDEYFVLGGNDQVNVTIVIVPEGDDECFLAVIANSSNGTAESARNKVRSLIPDLAAPAPMPHLP